MKLRAKIILATQREYDSKQLKYRSSKKEMKNVRMVLIRQRQIEK